MDSWGKGSRIMGVLGEVEAVRVGEGMYKGPALGM